MLFIDRRDGARVRDLGHYFAILPYLMRHRNEASVYFSKDIDVEKACAYSLGPEAGGQKPGLFAIAVAAAVRTLALKPRLNRFVKGRAVYQRKEIEVSFAVKRKPGQGSAEASTKIRTGAATEVEGPALGGAVKALAAREGFAPRAAVIELHGTCKCCHG